MGVSTAVAWSVALIALVIALIVFGPPLWTLDFSSDSATAPGPSVAFFVAQLFVFLLLFRLTLEIYCGIAPLTKWRCAVVATVLAALLFAPFIVRALSTAFPGSPNLQYGVFLIEAIVFVCLVRVSLL